MITLTPIGFVRCSRTDLSDDRWDHVLTHIELADDMDPDALAGLEEFSHAEILFHFDRIPGASVERRGRHPRGNREWPSRHPRAARQQAAQPPRRHDRADPGTGGACAAGGGLDAVDGTPVVDIKPVMREFLPREPVRQPAWASELMAGYWG